jgi:hypothetical protein
MFYKSLLHIGGRLKRACDEDFSCPEMPLKNTCLEVYFW